MVGSFALAHVEVNRTKMMKLSSVWFFSVGGWATVFALCFCASPASAYRPFDGTDAAVAGVNETEIELQPFGYQRTGSQSAAVAPFVVYNYGFADRWEMVLQTEMLTPITGGGQPSIAATGAFLKYVIVPGVLQEKAGVSIAA